MANTRNTRHPAMRDGGEPSNRPGNPLAQLAARQRELEAELAAARKANLQTRVRPGSKPWHIQPTHIQEDEGWYTTYLDVMTLLLVLLVVMLSFAGKGALEGFKEATGGSTVPAPRAAQAPPLEGLPEVDLGPLRAGIGLLPANNGLLPEIGIHHQHEAPAHVAQPPNIAQAPLPPFPHVTLPESLDQTALVNGPIAQEAPSNAPAGRPSPIEPAVIEPAAIEPAVIEPAPVNPAPANPAPANPASAEPKPLNSKQDMLAGLPVGELGDDIDVIVNERSVSFRINSEILFGSGEADLSVPGLAVLKRLIPVFNSVDHTITVEGHTDSVPMLRNRRYPSNWELSGARAGSVVRYLEANGVASNRLRAVGNADTRPLSDNSTPEGRASNRRVELIMERKED